MGDLPLFSPDERLRELEKEKARLFEELAEVARQQKDLVRQVLALEREQKQHLKGVEEYIAPADKELDLPDVERWVASVHWQFAKSMPHNPHSYAHVRWCDEAMFRRVARFIRERGYVQHYGGHGYWTVDMADSFLWTNSGDGGYRNPKPIESLILVNRKPNSLRPE